MKEKILNYFINEKGVTRLVANILSTTLLKYDDIAEEFCYWIDHRVYRETDELIISGYSARNISEIAPHLDSAGVYNFMVTLRDNPQKAEDIMKRNFPDK